MCMCDKAFIQPMYCNEPNIDGLVQESESSCYRMTGEPQFQISTEWSKDLYTSLQRYLYNVDNTNPT